MSSRKLTILKCTGGPPNAVTPKCQFCLTVFHAPSLTLCNLSSQLAVLAIFTALGGSIYTEYLLFCSQLSQSAVDSTLERGQRMSRSKAQRGNQLRRPRVSLCLIFHRRSFGRGPFSQVGRGDMGDRPGEGVPSLEGCEWSIGTAEHLWMGVVAPTCSSYEMTGSESYKYYLLKLSFGVSMVMSRSESFIQFMARVSVSRST